MSHAQPSAKSRNPMTIVVVVAVIIAVIGLVAMVGWLTSRTGSQTATADPMSAPLELPAEAGEFRLNPNDDPTSAPMTIGESPAQSITGTYYKESVKSLLVMAVRPVGESTDLVEELDITAVRDVGDGICGRYPTGQDVCIVRSDNVGVIGVGLDGQTLEDLVTDSASVATAITSQ